MGKLDHEEVQRIKKMIDTAMVARTKSDAKIYIRRLQMERSILFSTSKIDGSVNAKFGSLISTLNSAVGQVRDRDQRGQFVDRDWFVLERMFRERFF